MGVSDKVQGKTDKVQGKTDKVQGKTDITTTGALTEIGILLYPRVQMSAVLGLTDLFGVANRLSAEHGGSCSNVKVSVTVDSEPKMVQNFKLGSATYFTGVGGTVAIKFADSKGPIVGMPVKESNTSNGGKLTENPNALKTDSKGIIGDLVGKGHTESKPTETPADVKEGKEVLTTNPVTSTTTQTLTFTTTGASGQPCTCQATYSRTLTNTDSKGNLNTQNNSNGVNYTLTTTQPTVKQKEQPQ